MLKRWGVPAILVAAAGAWLGWAARPVVIAYRAGCEIGRMQGAKEAAAGRGEPVPPEGP